MSTRWIVIGGYLVLTVAVIVLQVVARREGSRVASVGELFSAAMRHPAGRVAVLLAWWWVGWHLLARSGVLEI